jgi:hypothetical protein
MLNINFDEWKKDVVEHKYKILLAVLFLAIAMLALTVSSQYVDEIHTVAVPDLILDSIPVIDLSPIFVWGILLVLVVYIAYPLLYRPKKFHYALGMLSLFLLVRSAFVVLTHLKVPVGAIPVASQGFFQFLTYSNDLFFSGHAGLPFLGFLVFNDSKVKYFMLTASIILAITVLFMHVHYSIDVASAYFITYGIFVIGKPLFGDSGDLIDHQKNEHK